MHAHMRGTHTHNRVTENETKVWFELQIAIGSFNILKGTEKTPVIYVGMTYIYVIYIHTYVYMIKQLVSSFLNTFWRLETL